MSKPSVEQQYRRFLLSLSGFIFAGSALELVFLEHYEAIIQYLPFVLSGVGLITVLIAIRKASQSSIKWLRYVMWIVGIGGIFGMYQHLEHNFDFAVEISPNISTMGAFWESLYGASPFLAPGILCLGALLGYAATWRHPLLSD
ncbi:hypothetical protein NC796_17220 [Aliifodinibius sp. S!AR15-10]|uniref:hypothetical protein n=1 Tax=Aliifodinibius sp. S!AR15-10 TaxID=2950437 RepID=UPI00285CA207|nr:hypothetical protein [Aliifodinibius sp. S!AR15-10]MDR8392900.1 hypothetical protein [Aliifodinibius sp. S!AR15-10]